MSEDVADLAERVRRLEREVAELRSSTTAAPRSGPPVPDDERFWVLHGLRERVPAPGAVLFAGSVRVGEGEQYAWQEERDTEALLERDWGELARALAALSNPVRLTLLREVLGGRTAAAELGADERFGTSGQLYHHLRQLVAAGWLTQTRRGNYRIPAGRVIPLLTVVLGVDR